MSRPLDVMRLEVLRNRFTAIAEEMSVVLQRAAFSTNIKTRLDHSCALLDADGRVIAQSFGQPAHLGTLVHFVPSVLRDFGDTLGPGEGLICNDAYFGGIHLNDVAVIVPIHERPDGGELVAYAAAMAHHIDVGGGTPGSIGLHREQFQEGLIIPPTRFLDHGVPDPRIVGLILRNVRSPRETGGDLRAQIAAVNIGAARLRELVASEGTDAVLAAKDALFAYTERRARAALAAFPRGVYEAEDWLDGDGFGGGPVRIAVKITIDDDGVLFDLSGCDKQRPSSINTTMAMTFSGCAYALRVQFDPDIPVNDGFYRLVRIHAPKGLVCNAVAPAAVGAGSEVGLRLCEVSLRALAPANPDAAVGDFKGTILNISLGGIDPRTGQYFVFYETVAGGGGARREQDGIDGVQPHIQNTENAPVEETERGYPFRVECYELIDDSGGAGRRRGGLGLRRDYVPEGDLVFSVMGDRVDHAPRGIFGGGNGRAADFVRNPGTPDEQHLGSKFSVHLAAGERLSVQIGGGGGYGDPAEREPERVDADVRTGRVTPAAAERDYGPR